MKIGHIHSYKYETVAAFWRLGIKEGHKNIFTCTCNILFLEKPELDSGKFFWIKCIMKSQVYKHLVTLSNQKKVMRL